MQWSKEKQKEEGEKERENKQALHSDREYAAVIEIDFRKLKKKKKIPNFVYTSRAPLCQSHQFYHVWWLPAFYSSNRGTAGNGLKLLKTPLF